MAVRSKRLASRVQLTPANTDTAVYTAPSGETALVKWVVISNPSAGAATVWLGVAGVGPGQGGNYVKVAVPADDAVGFEVWWVVPETVPLNGESNVNTVRVSLFGAELEGVAD